ncbi:UbiD family decarboxylase [Aspergillus saccharolyticus JOP 1030-1]|uniref:Phenacrylate decarboxylase n=1 Tax=Aspergillus saccharolyticus JOP 1030-1 TaxID=1450539 RepID=A0A318ZC60_9EURO|nr:hypothetical protein BP01DRAFT_424496 [Aspergillus saccharolyticus JOP 1030-1]PYH43904.1 hypothetical protein BP01DRAFT_424496 [Aspergillus saccharolyticus JOP 1030-1]
MDETASYEDTQTTAGSFRRFIQELHAESDLVAIDEEAPLFDNVKGRHPNGLFRVLGAPVGASQQPGKRFIRIAKSLGLPSTASGQDIINKFREAKSCQIPPTEAPTDPGKEFKLLGDEIDLTALPVPKLHADDGGKFLQTFGMYIVQSPDNTWVNWSITRSILHGERSLVGPMIPRKNIGLIRQIGMPLPKGVNESAYIGALIGSPIEVTKAEMNGILVPANAEIIFEGIMAITYRKVPILPICVTGRAPEESETVWGLTQAAEVLTISEDAGLPIKMVWNPFESHCHWFVLQVDREKLRELNTAMEEFSMKVFHTVFASKPGYNIPIIYLLGDDIDPTNLRDVI